MFHDGTKGRNKAAGNLSPDFAKSLLQGGGKQVSPIEVVKTNGIDCDMDITTTLPCTLSFSGENVWGDGIAFRGLGDSFEVAIKFDSYATTPYFMLGILPDDTNLCSNLENSQQAYQMKGFFANAEDQSRFVAYPGRKKMQLVAGPGEKELRMRFHTSPLRMVRYRLYNGAPVVYHDSDFVNVPVSAKCCPVLLLRAQGGNRSLTITKLTSLEADSSRTPPSTSSLLASNDTMFLITSDLEILESGSFCSAVTLLRRFHVSDVSKLSVENVEFGTPELLIFVSALLRGKRNVFAEIWPECLVVESSDNSTDGRKSKKRPRY